MEEGGPMAHWNQQLAPEVARLYWQLPVSWGVNTCLQ